MIEKLNTILAQLPPNWLGRVSGGAGPSPEAELRKMLGEPLPKTIDPKDLPKELGELFATYGMLQNIKRKLEWVSRRKGKKIIPAKNTIACVDEDDNLYMGVDFLKKYKDDEDLIAGIMAHEWGHMMSELAPGADLSHLNWDELFEVRREEEAAADAFAGRALFQMGYQIEQMVNFLKQIADIDKKANTHKYHSAETRAAILHAAFDAQREAIRQLRNLFGSANIVDPSTSRLIAVV